MNASLTIVADWFAKNKGRRCDLVLAGHIFGGRYGESPQLLSRIEYNSSDGFSLEFETSEVLTVLSPKEIKISKDGDLIVDDAERISFGWHYYGKPQSNETWCEEVWEKEGDLYVEYFVGTNFSVLNREPVETTNALEIIS